MTDWWKFLTSDPRVCHGQLCAAGTGVLATNTLDSLAEGSTPEEILRSYPSLQPIYIDAALAYAAELARPGGREHELAFASLEQIRCERAPSARQEGTNRSREREPVH